MLDTPAPKRPRLDAPKEVVPPTPAALPVNAFSLPVNAFSLPEPPSIGPRRSSRVSAAPKVNYFNDFADVDRDSESSPDVESEDSSDDDLTDVDEMFGDLEDDDLFGAEEEAEENSPATTSAKKSRQFIPFTDATGRLRIGPQPKAPAMYIKWAPRKEAISRIKTHSRLNYKEKDRKIKQSVSIDHDSELAAIQDKLIGSLEEYGADSDKLTGTCDYTGVDFSWDPSYQAFSMEAIYPFSMLGESIAYHTKQNIGTVSIGVNRLKRWNMIIHPPLIAALIRLHDTDTPLKEHKGRLAWLFNALTNEASFENLYHFRGSHQSRVDEWTKWTPAKRRDILEAARTGTKSTRISRDVASLQPNELFYIRWKKDIQSPLSSDV